MPIQWLARRDARNDPWVQSWKTMNVRTRKPAAGMTSATASSVETLSAAYMSAVMAR